MLTSDLSTIRAVIKRVALFILGLLFPRLMAAYQVLTLLYDGYVWLREGVEWVLGKIWWLFPGE